MNSLTSIFRGYCENDFEFYDYIETARTPHNGLQGSIFLKDANAKQRKFSPFDYSINIIDIDYLTQVLNDRFYYLFIVLDKFS